MKIGIFHSTLPAPDRKAGGVEVFVHRLACALADSADEVEVISYSDAPPGAPYRHRKLFSRLPFLRKAFPRLYLAPLLLNFVDLRGYDVLHFHGDDWFYFRRPLPTLRTLHGSALFESRSAKSRKRKWSQWLVYRLEHLAARLADVVLGVGREAAAIYHADGVGNLFVSKSMFFPGGKSAAPSFVFIGSWGGRKRGAFVAERFLNDILPRHPNARLFMACEYAPASPAITWLQAPSDAQLAEIIRTAWALLSASTYEGFGIPYLEAIASGTMVVTTPNSGAAYVLDGGACGCIVSEPDYSAKLLEIIGDAKLRSEYERLGLARAEVFSEASVIAEHRGYYDLAIRRFAARGARK